MSRGVYRAVHSALFDDVRFQQLTPEARHVLLTCRLCSACGPAGIFRYYPEVLLKQTGYVQRPDVVKDALDELARERWIQHDSKRFVIWIVNGLRHDPHVRLADKKHRTSVERQLEGLPKSPLVAKFRKHYKLSDPSKGPRRPGAVSPSEKDTEKEKETEKETPPSPLVPSAQGDRKLRRTEAWSSVVEATKKWDESTMPPFRDDLIPDVVAKMGGWSRFRRLGFSDAREADFTSLRTEFDRVFDLVAASRGVAA